MMCIAFSSTLTRSAHAWFSQLPKGIIQDFDELSERFVASFVGGGGMKPKEASTHLFNVI